jgi:endonuclease/exonuclease/phosphatase family metal-dependent hydrolase
VATFNIETNRNEAGWPNFALGDPGGVDFDSVASILSRIDADVVALQEVHTSELSGSPSEISQLAALLGLPHIHAGSNSGNFDTSLRVVFLSRYPFTATDSIFSPLGAKEIARHSAVVAVDVPGTDADPLLISAHLKSGSTTVDRFRRAIEMRRLADYVAASGLQASDNFIVLGDFNPSGVNRSFTELPSGLPGSYALGSDVSFPVSYSTHMLSYFSGLVPTQLDPRQLNGDDATYEFGQTLDLLLVSPGLAGRPYGTEIYNSALDISNGDGLPKNGSPLAAGTSAEASDHLAVFADFELDQAQFNLGLAVSAPSVAEGDPAGTANLTVSLAGPAESQVTVTLSSSDPAAQAVDGTLVIPTGQSSASTAIATSRNFVAEGSRLVTFSATASGYAAAAAGIVVNDSDSGYAFSQPGESIVENFDGFSGLASPAPWSADAGVWSGIDDGSSPGLGGRGYGVGQEVAVGYLSDGSNMVIEAPFLNDSSVPLTLLDVGFVVEQWRSAFEGAGASVEVDLVLDGLVTPLPELTVNARQDLPDGPVSGAYETPRSARVGGLNVPPGGSFTLRFRFESSGAAPLPDDVFVNEFHYQNSGTDPGEFVEVVVGPGYSGELSAIELVLYNGNGGGIYGSTHGLDGFTPGVTTPTGHQFFSKLISGIQNGDPDGFALVVDGGVAEFLSYRGSFTATEGPANGANSIDVGVDQQPERPAGEASIRRIGTGTAAADFTWLRSDELSQPPVPHSPGQLNDGQTLVLPGLPAQGMAVDSLVVGFVEDTDLDGVGDDEDPDDDNDGQSDEYELAFGSDPQDAASAFEVAIGSGTVAFPGVAGISYEVEWSVDLSDWDPLATVVGADQEIEVILPTGGDRVFVRVRAGE